MSEAIESNYIASLGPMVDAFQKEFSEKVGIKHAVAVSSGTAAMHLALRALRVSPTIEKGDREWCETRIHGIDISKTYLIFWGQMMKEHYPVIIEQDSEGVFIVECPLFKGCRSYGYSVDEAMKNIREAIEACIEDTPAVEERNTFVGVRDLEIGAP